MTRESGVRIGVVGLGKMGLMHASIFNGLSGSRVVAVAEPTAVMRRAFKEMQSPVSFYDNVEGMLQQEERLDAVVITTPVATHVPVSISCVKHGVPFFVEKPLAVSANQAADLGRALRESPTPHMVGFMTRFVEAFRKGKDLIASGCLGRLQRVLATIYVSQLFTQGQGWRYDRKVSGGGVLLSQGSHLMDLLAWYFGPVARVNADMLSIYSSGIEDFAHVMLEFQGGLRAWVDCSWSVRFHRTVEITIDVLGDNGALVVQDDNVRIHLDRSAGGAPAGGSSWNAVDLFRGVELDIGEPQYSREDEAFLQGLRLSAMPEPGFRQAYHIQQIVDAAYASSQRKGEPISIPKGDF